MVKEVPDIPQDIQRVLYRFERWRNAHTGRLPIPDALWAAAVGLAQKHGVFHTARVLRLEYGKLKRLVESASPVSNSRNRKVRAGRRGAESLAPPTFVELMASPAAGQSECLIELEGRRGKMRIQWKGTTAPDLGGLSRAFWESK
jgi:hypothetical protein